MRTADLPFTLKGRTFAGGTVLVRAAENGADLGQTLGAIVAQAWRGSWCRIDSAFVEGGISLGSGERAGAQGAARADGVGHADAEPVGRLGALRARAPLRPAGDRGARPASLGRVDLDRVRRAGAAVGQLHRRFAARGCGGSRTGSTRGGTLVTLAEASRWAARDSGRPARRRPPSCEGGKPDVEPTERRARTSRRPTRRRSRSTSRRRSSPSASGPTMPGALLRATLDLEHWLSAGTDGEIQVMVEGSRIFTPIKLDKGRNVARLQQARHAGCERPRVGRRSSRSTPARRS